MTLVRMYRKRGGARTTPLPDFFIGAHAEVENLALLTRDVVRFRTYFPKVKLIAVLLILISYVSIGCRALIGPQAFDSLPDWDTKKQDAHRPAPNFKVGDRFMLKKPMFLMKTPIKPPYWIEKPGRGYSPSLSEYLREPFRSYKLGGYEVMALLPAGTVITLRSLKDQGQLNGLATYFSIDGYHLEKWNNWVKFAGFFEYVYRNGQRLYVYDRSHLKKLSN